MEKITKFKNKYIYMFEYIIKTKSNIKLIIFKLKMIQI